MYGKVDSDKTNLNTSAKVCVYSYMLQLKRKPLILMLIVPSAGRQKKKAGRNYKSSTTFALISNIHKVVEGRSEVNTN